MEAATSGTAAEAPGPGVECPVCGHSAERFEPFGMRKVQPDRMCASCRSQPRHRAVWLYFQRHTNLFTDRVQMLHCAPEPCLSPRLAAHRNIDYLTADLEPGRAMVEMDITDIQLPDGSFDVVYASHVLEHIPDDRAAMRELCRVLRPGGWAVLLVPIFGETTREDPSVVDPAERERLFGQFNHVRMYGNDGEYERRLTEAGFRVETHNLVAELGPELSARYGLLAGEDIYRCVKPGEPERPRRRMAGLLRSRRRTPTPAAGPVTTPGEGGAPSRAARRRR